MSLCRHSKLVHEKLKAKRLTREHETFADNDRVVHKINTNALYYITGLGEAHIIVSHLRSYQQLGGDYTVLGQICTTKENRRNS